MQQTVASRCSTAVTVALAATVLSGCAATDRLMSSVELPATGTPASRAPASAGVASGKLMVTGQQRAYLDALTAGGVRPSSELMALSIGSYVCQARAAGQSSQAVWDFVHPLVSNDVHNAEVSRADGSRAAPTPSDVDAATASYIRIATQRLC